MQEPRSPLGLLESQNPYPDCFLMELEAILVQSDSTDTEQFDLYLTVNFNEQWEPILDGRVKFGLKGGELRLRLENGKISLSESDRDLGDSFAIATKDSIANPAWVFALKTGESLLKGTLKQAKLGTVTVTAKPFLLAATFAASQSDISLTDAEGLWRHDISPNKHGVLERKLVLFLLENKFKPYLSWAQLGSVGSQFWQSLAEKSKEEMAPQGRSQLKALIQRIYEAKTDDFLKLAKLAGLNPMTDLAGGNLLATELSGVDLGGANLYRANFRGADLTDADLSEANLSHAKFSGADLSGAYLGNANLTNADLYRASLALANLIGANLSGANLKEANLSNANLSGAKVSEARFGSNPGIREETKLDLKQRGAIFE